jgi:hypothetical protein
MVWFVWTKVWDSKFFYLPKILFSSEFSCLSMVLENSEAKLIDSKKILNIRSFDLIKIVFVESINMKGAITLLCKILTSFLNSIYISPLDVNNGKSLFFEAR